MNAYDIRRDSDGYTDIAGHRPRAVARRQRAAALRRQAEPNWLALSLSIPLNEPQRRGPIVLRVLRWAGTAAVACVGVLVAGTAFVAATGYATAALMYSPGAANYAVGEAFHGRYGVSIAAAGDYSQAADCANGVTTGWLASIRCGDEDIVRAGEAYCRDVLAGDYARNVLRLEHPDSWCFSDAARDRLASAG